ncbi:ABC transporter permease [Parablautia intestinalis]|uniref:ABC transporter permease n=1 Tax=Parablautia intestinalis TaxID=2320100 RepID=UPI00256ED72F|nr:ABC transporter permease [Parablautia intestinalis]
MLENQMIIRAGMKRHKGSLFGIAILMFLTALSLTAVLMIAYAGNSYIREEMERAGFGDLTAWTADVPDMEFLLESIRGQEGVEAAEVQRLIFSEYEANGVESDSEGQMIPWVSSESGISTRSRYRFFENSLSGYAKAPEEIGEQEVYVSPSMKSMMDLEPGDTITFPIARGGQNISLTVAGYYEDPFMGSSMIGMKGFLISEKTYEEILSVIEESGMDALARDGSMIHMETAEGITVSEMNRVLTTNTPLSMYTEFIHSGETIAGFMMILQNAFSALFAAFAVVLLGAALAVMGHSISGLVEQEWKNFGILKTIGFTRKQLAGQVMMQYMTAVGSGVVMGMLLAVPVSGRISRMMVTTTGVLLPIRFPVLPCMGVLAVLLLLSAGFCFVRLGRLGRISPMAAIRRENGEQDSRGKHMGYNPRIPAIRAKGLTFHLALRQVLTGRRRYVSACLVAAMLVFFASLAGRINGWLGTDGKGMMDAFNPADLDLGVQVLGKLPAQGMEQMVLSYTDITDSYMLAMPSVSVNGTNYTANVITEPERFHISAGQTCMGADEVVLTEVLAADLGVGTGDTVTIRGNKGSREFRVSGIYHCANDMGANLGMSREGYLSIGEDDSRLWCYHYFLSDPSRKQALTEELEQTYGGNVHVHENSWPGLFGIISAMHVLIIFLYGVSAVFVCIVTGMAGARILDTEQKDIGIYKSIGCSVEMLRLSFALRFGLVAAVGAVIGTLAAVCFTDVIVSSVMRLAGISNFASGNTTGSILVPGLAVTFLFLWFAWLLAGRIRKEDMNVLTAE